MVSNVIKYKQGDVIFRKGELEDCMYDIQWGRIGIYELYESAHPILLKELQAGDFFGEMGLIEVAPRSATAVCLSSDAGCVQITTEMFAEDFKDRPMTIYAIMQQMSSRIRELSARNTYLSNLQKSDSIFKDLLFAGGKAMDSRIVKFKKGDIIFKKDQFEFFMYNIQWGTVGIYEYYGTSQQRLIKELKEGDFFGEMGLIEVEPRSATAVCITEDAGCMLITSDMLTEYFKEKPAQIYSIMQQLSGRIRSLNMQVAALMEQVEALKKEQQ